MKWKALFLILGSMFYVHAVAQTPATPLVTQAVDESKLVTLHGNVHPLTRSGIDQGAVADSFSAGRMILLLNRAPEREAALQQFLQAAHTHGSANYHKWLTPEQFGEQFGAADSDLQAATGWLASHGLAVEKVSKSRRYILFSGTAGQLRKAFHTEIHQYSVNGERHYANATELQIPAALASLVGGVTQMNDFRAQPQIAVAGKALYAPGAHKTDPLWTQPNPYGTSNPNAYTVTPEDFATQYDLGPLYAAGVNGAGQTIGIINESNINLSLVQDYQSLFGVAGSLPQVVIDGDDPGDLAGVDVEAYLDVEVSGAVAPKAAVNLYIAGASNVLDPLALAAFRAVEDNQASVLSVSFGECEVYLGTAGNQFWSGLWEQAAAQGQTVFVSSGDSGSLCSPGVFPVAVSGLTSTPWNISVGGTDFYYSDYATGGASATTLWRTNNDASLGSLIAPLPEQPWDDAFGFNVIANGYQRGEYGAGGGGASSCSTSNASTDACLSGYAKPSWQIAPGVPSDGVRDIPDLSLFASNGANLSAYAVCAYEGDCAAGSGGNAEILLVGGTSASSPAMAGIMALVNQKYGRQGQADFTLYPLAQQKPAAFHDITVGNNSYPCIVEENESCVLEWNGIFGTSQYPAGPGYDLASGLGSVDANVLVNDWNTVTFKPTTTTLSLSGTSVAHGTPINLTTTVASTSGAGTPTGNVAILTNSTLPSDQSQTFITLNNGTGGKSINYLPGGSYQVTGQYGGDGIFASSTSSPQTLTVTPEKSNINFWVLSSGSTLPVNGGKAAYNTPLALFIQPIGVSAAAGTANGHATGSATFTIDSTSTTVALNSDGVATWTPPALSIGTHTASASYSGDASFAASASTPVTFSVTLGVVRLNDSEFGPFTFQSGSNEGFLPGIFMNTGSTLTVSVTATGWDTYGASPSQIPLGTSAPTGTVQICLGTYPGLYNDCGDQMVYSQTATLAPLSGTNAPESLAVATFPNLAANTYFVSMVYNGDSNWGVEDQLDTRAINVESLPALAPTTTILSITPTSISGTQSAKVTATITGTGNAGTSPKGEIDFYNNGVYLTYYSWNTGVAGATSTITFAVNPTWFNESGSNQLTAVYSGDSANGPSLSNVVNFTSTRMVGDFTLALQSPQITVQPGSTGSVLLNLQSLSSFNGSVSLSCTPSSTQFSCSVNPTVTLNGTAAATVTINAVAQTAGLLQPAREGPVHWPMAAGMLAFVLFLSGGKARHRLTKKLLLCFVLLTAFSVTGCGSSGSSGGGGGGGGGGQSNTPAGTYSVLVTATANGVIHNARITVVVP
ncbi:MAG: Ig-like domain repeat protein [Terracidiphilus sp.]|jgi:hypothetical protein